MMIASRQPAAELPGAIPTYDVVSLNTGYSAETIISTEQNIHLVLSNDASAVSALRVCQVLLERLGGQHQETRQAQLLTEDMHAMLYRVCCSSTMFRVQPSLVAMAIIYCLRSKRGLVPLWPAALVQLTGIYDPTVGDLGLLLEQLMPLLGVSQQPPPAPPAKSVGQAAAPGTPPPLSAATGGQAQMANVAAFESPGITAAAATAPAGSSTDTDGQVVAPCEPSGVPTVHRLAASSSAAAARQEADGAAQQEDVPPTAPHGTTAAILPPQAT
jgi:hypothetical protein